MMLRQFSGVMLGALGAGLLTAPAPVAAAVDAQSIRLHGIFCVLDSSDLAVATSVALQSGLQIQNGSGTGHAICPLYSNQLDEIDSGNVGAFVQMTPHKSGGGCGASSIKMCVVASDTGSHSCGTAVSTGSDCNAASLYPVDGSGQRAEWLAHGAGFPYLYITNGASTLTIGGYGFHEF